MTILNVMITTSRRQGQTREGLSGGRPSLRGEWAQGHETHRFDRYGKCGSRLQDAGEEREQDAEALCSDSSCSYLGRSA